MTTRPEPIVFRTDPASQARRAAAVAGPDWRDQALARLTARQAAQPEQYRHPADREEQQPCPRSS